MALIFTVVFVQKRDTLALFSAILYECVTQENPEMLPTYIAIDQVRNIEITHTIATVVYPTLFLES